MSVSIIKKTGSHGWAGRLLDISQSLLIIAQRQLSGVVRLDKILTQVN